MYRGAKSVPIRRSCENYIRARNKRRCDRDERQRDTRDQSERKRLRGQSAFSRIHRITKTGGDKQRLKRGNALSAISTHNFVVGCFAAARMFAMYTQTSLSFLFHTCRLSLAHHFRPFTTECNFVPTWHMPRARRQHPARQITALFALSGTSKRNKDLVSKPEKRKREREWKKCN